MLCGRQRNEVCQAAIITPFPSENSEQCVVKPPASQHCQLPCRCLPLIVQCEQIRSVQALCNHTTPVCEKAAKPCSSAVELHHLQSRAATPAVTHWTCCSDCSQCYRCMPQHWHLGCTYQGIWHEVSSASIRSSCSALHSQEQAHRMRAAPLM